MSSDVLDDEAAPVPTPAQRARAAVLLVARIAVVVGIYYVILQNVSLADVRPLLTPALSLALAASVGLNVLQAALCTVRWRLLARGVPRRPGFLPCFAAYLEGLFFNQALPSFIGGDAVRILRWRAFGVSAHDGLVSVLRDRLFGAIGAAVLAFGACGLLWQLELERYKVFTAFALAAAALLGGAGVLMVIQSRRVTRRLARFRRIHAVLQRISDAPLGPRVYALSTLYSVVGQMLSGLSVFLLARSLGISQAMWLLVAITGIILVISMIPVSLAGWGVREASFLAILVPLGERHESVMLLGVTFGLAGLLGALFGGLSILLGASLPPQARRAAAT